jgi:putative protein kinase ArgK-like GTPase of G3E family
MSEEESSLANDVERWRNVNARKLAGVGERPSLTGRPLGVLYAPQIADVFVVNKADRPGADDTVLELTSALALAAPRPWQARIVRCVGRSGEGLDELWSALMAHREHLTATNGLQLRRRQRRLRDLTNAVHALAIRHADELLHSAQFADLAAAAAAGDITPTVAARRVLAGGAEQDPGSRPGPRPN